MIEERRNWEAMVEKKNCVEVLKKHLTKLEGGMEKEFITVRELAKKLGTDHQWLRRKIRAGEIPCYRIGAKLLLKKEEIDKWIESQKIEVRN